MSDRRKIKIQILGECGTGKSTIAQLIKDTLSDHGFGVILDDEDSINFPPDKALVDLRLKNLVNKFGGLDIWLETVNVSSRSKFLENMPEVEEETYSREL